MNLLDQKFTPQTWPEHPETATHEGKINLSDFWLFLAGETVLVRIPFRNISSVKGLGS
jgi:cytochrome c oxidase subunit 3